MALGRTMFRCNHIPCTQSTPSGDQQNALSDCTKDVAKPGSTTINPGNVSPVGSSPFNQSDDPDDAATSTEAAVQLAVVSAPSIERAPASPALLCEFAR